MNNNNKNTTHGWAILAVIHGFYFFGRLTEAPDGYITLAEGAAFVGFTQSIADVASGNPKASDTLARFDKNRELTFPISSVCAILPSVNLYTQKTTTV